MGEKALLAKPNAGVPGGEIAMAAASFQQGGQKRSLFIERLRQDVNSWRLKGTQVFFELFFQLLCGFKNFLKRSFISTNPA